MCWTQPRRCGRSARRWQTTVAATGLCAVWVWAVAADGALDRPVFDRIRLSVDGAPLGEATSPPFRVRWLAGQRTGGRWLTARALQGGTIVAEAWIRVREVRARLDRAITSRLVRRIFKGKATFCATFICGNSE